MDAATVKDGGVVVIGGGTMGAGIAESFVRIGAVVTLVEVDRARAESARDRITSALSADVTPRGQAPLPVAGRLEIATELSTCVGTALVVEAVPEDFDLKLDVLARAERAFPTLPLLTTNTSSLSIDELAKSLQRPTRFLGMHFFNPVPRSQLIEIVVGSETERAVVELAAAWADRLGKESIEVRDSPGFATSRLGLAIGLEAIRMLEEGVASAEDIDRGMVLGYRFPVGPLKLTDIVGLDVRLAIAEHLAAALGDRFTPPGLLREMVEKGYLGQKASRGFYRW
jgi:3-hydroxybutyryl-CoA dehydrogenase